ncbi:MAG TPA: hypothetical protein VMP67_03695 [Candidatus Limnocylindria bacterium]|nr:hypothetical protein [Candidatus Limnocylindria bacterium]
MRTTSNGIPVEEAWKAGRDEPPAKVSREILEDRYEGLIYVGVDNSKLQERLFRVIGDILVGLTHTIHDQENGLWAGRDLESDLNQAIREAAIRLVDEAGAAR